MRLATKTIPSLFLSTVLLAGTSACSEGEPSEPPPSVEQTRGWTPEDGAKGLEALFVAIHAAKAANDKDGAEALTRSLIPDKDVLKKVFKDDVPADAVDKALAFYAEKIPAGDGLADLLVPGKGRTEITVHAATTEELIQYREGTPASKEFPGGARLVAQQTKPGMTFYEVELTEPGKAHGMKYHLFFWDGSKWRMLGPAWRFLRA